MSKNLTYPANSTPLSFGANKFANSIKKINGMNLCEPCVKDGLGFWKFKRMNEVLLARMG